MLRSLQSLRWTNRLQLPEQRSTIKQGRHISRGISISCWPRGDSNPLGLLRRTQCLGSSPHRTRSESIYLLNSISKRFASTKPEVPHNINPSSTSDAAPLSNLTSDFTSSSLDGIPTGIPAEAIGEHFGFLKQLGLDFGWGPTAVYETMLESVHLATGTPWWGSILLTALLVRLVFLPLNIRASDTSARLRVMKPLTDPINERMNIAKATRDVEAVRLATKELYDLYKVANIKMRTLFIAPVGQALLGYGSFRLLRNMANLPVPGMDESGFLWLQDLTISDPYLILPMSTAIMLHWTFKKGGEAGVAAQTMNKTFQKFMEYVVPLISMVCTAALPASVQLSFSASAALATLQSHYLRQKWVREYLGIQPLSSTADAPSKSPYKGTMTTRPSPTPVMEQPPAPKGIVGGAISDIKGAASQVMKTARSQLESQDQKLGNQRLTQAELKRAHAYEAQRRREIAQEKLDAESAYLRQKKNSAQ